MSVTPFVPTLPTTSAPGKGSKADGTGKPSSDEKTEKSTGAETLDGFLAALSTAMTAVAQPVPVPADGSVTPSPSGPAESVSAIAAAMRGLPGSGGNPFDAALPGTVVPTTPAPGTTGPTTPSTSSAPSAGDPPGTPGGASATVPAPPTVDQSPLPADAPAGGEESTLPPASTVGGSPLSDSDPGDSDGTDDQPPGSAPPAVTAVPLPAAPVTVTPVAPVTAPVNVAVDATGTGEPTTAVLRQVFPEVTRVATQAGPGTHRLSITLHPENLGEVNVTLVIRAGAVHVNLAAGSGAAHDALLQGAPELHRLLEVAGGDARVVVRDASSSSASAASASATTSTSADQRGADQRGQQAAYAPSADRGGSGDPGASGRNARTTTSGSVDEPTSPRGIRPGSPTGASEGNGASTAVHSGRVDRLM
ncbi:flagellar hook-length control protein FliK [Nocardioides sp. CER19]|uniref:flagellar hook-length control protein FliK n=1 Tax=Nocardioides sp. CER19 TaxID=3038538 RepID=UPI00244BF5F5|nr:flagellar hook-length control protein FliK [Nocardioides sp. CER19]MDH2414625.1 flagellar hook-length control protein FliK [Nocardioides sp. CER19]